MTITVAHLQLEAMTGRHVTPVRAIDQVVYARPWSVATWQQELGGDDRHHIVALAPDGDSGSSTLIGHAGLLFVGDEAHITTVATDPDTQSRGVATQMLLALFDEVIRRSIESVTLEVRAADRRAQLLYGRFGMAPAGVRPRYYTDPVDDAIVMWIHDVGGEAAVERRARIRSNLEQTHES